MPGIAEHEVERAKAKAKEAAVAPSAWRTLRDDVNSIKIEDPANPHGNDLTELLSESVRRELSTTASQTLATIDREGWEGVFGELADSDDEKKAAVIDGRPFGECPVAAVVTSLNAELMARPV
jgi:hypothetical protein